MYPGVSSGGSDPVSIKEAGALLDTVTAFASGMGGGCGDGMGSA